MMTPHQKAIRDRQLDPSDDLYWKSRGWEGRPWDWQSRFSLGDVHPPERKAGVTTLTIPPIPTWEPLISVGNLTNQNNPDHLAYWQARGWDEMPDRSEKLNPNNDAYWVLKGYEERPDDWRNRV